MFTIHHEAASVLRSRTRAIRSKFLLAVLSSFVFLLSACGGGDAPALEGTYTGTAGRGSTPITFNLSQSGTSVTGTVLFDGRIYVYEGTLTGSTLDGIASFNNSVACDSLSFTRSTVSPDRSDLSGRMSKRETRCDCDPDDRCRVSGGSGNYAAIKQ